MAGVVLPVVVPADIGAIAGVYVGAIGVYIGVPALKVVVDDDRVVAAPAAAPPVPAVAAATPHRAHRHSDAETDGRSGDHCACRWRIVHRRIRINRRSVDYGRVVAWNIDDLRVSRLDHDDRLRLD